MKKIPFTMLLLLVSFYVFSQAPCDLTTKTDEFTGRKTVATKEFIIMDVFPIIGNRKPWDIKISFVYTNDTTKIVVNHSSQYVASVIKRISFKLANDQVVIKDTPMRGLEYKRLGYDMQYTVFNASKEEIAKFSNSEIVKIRVEFFLPMDYDPLYEKELKGKKATPIKDIAACILQEYK